MPSGSFSIDELPGLDSAARPTPHPELVTPRDVEYRRRMKELEREHAALLNRHAELLRLFDVAIELFRSNSRTYSLYPPEQGREKVLTAVLLIAGILSPPTSESAP